MIDEGLQGNCKNRYTYFHVSKYETESLPSETCFGSMNMKVFRRKSAT